MRGLVAFLRARSPRQILLAGWCGFLAYGFPGFMSYDSIMQLRMSRLSWYVDGHPPAMAALWRILEWFVAGPVGMLFVQSVCFLVGAYLVFSRVMSARAAAISASLLLWFPPIAAIMAVIWKDSQMAGWMLLGFGLVIQDRRRTRLFGLAALAVATMMRHNALAITGPLIVLCFVWNPAHRFVRRYGLAFAAWVAVTLTAQVVSTVLIDEEQHLWHTRMAPADIVQTLRYATPDIPEAELARDLDGVVLKKPLHELVAATRSTDLSHDYSDQIWWTTKELFAIPRTPAARDAMTRAWKAIVLSHLDAYLTYRVEMTRILLGVGEPMTSPVYNWFSDVQDPGGSAAHADHDATGARLQDVLREAIHVVGATPMFHVVLYAILCVLLVPFALRERTVLALLASAITSELVLFAIAPTTDWRYSFWLIVSAIIATVMLVASRVRSRTRLA